MNKPLLKNILLVLLGAITMFSVFKYVESLKERHDLFVSLNEAEEKLSVLEEEKQNLLADLEKEKDLREQLMTEASLLKDNVKATRKRLIRLFAENREKALAFEELNYKFSILQAENLALLEEKENIGFKLSDSNAENETLKVKLGSIQELKKSIRELKIKMRSVRFVPKKPKELYPLAEAIEGNRGFLVKDGKTTFPGKIRIEVRPASTIE